MSFSPFVRALALGAVTIATATSQPARAGVGDLLVAPTRIILNGGRGTEIILKNIGDATATYRVSAELRRMTPEGVLVEVTNPSADEKAAQDMVVFAPRKVTLPPNSPQAVRVSARAPQGLPDGEYRIHLLFRAIPDPTPVTAPTQASGLAFKLIPVYGVTIPVIVRLGSLEAKAGIADVQFEQDKGRKLVTLQLTRNGTRSTYGEVRVIKPGVKDPVAVLKGVAVYKELSTRKVSVPVSADYKGPIAGPVTVQYYEVTDNGATLAAETSATLR
ncbi:molecular chaperone [Sphingomonas rhizophila]|uniref:Molecular chaperone n=1 Tax=Sphingomonas rhizophila TaxID=2071607 RepID=A0A7G9SAL4_9SPHN|nr:molecular chaperone [Sphingomonas rhizophila]QNN64889.1 molecular chaperone [Sphingomonas rhizophila]